MLLGIALPEDPRAMRVLTFGVTPVRLPGIGNSKSHGARPVHLVIRMMKWIRTSSLSIKKSFSRVAKADRRNPLWGSGPGRALLWMVIISTVSGVCPRSDDEP